MDELIEEICDNVCKCREAWDGDQDEFIDEVCADCPVTRLSETLRQEYPMGFNPYQE